MKEIICSKKFIWFRVPQKHLRVLFYSKKTINKKTYKKMLYYRKVLATNSDYIQHLVSIIDMILLKKDN